MIIAGYNSIGEFAKDVNLSRTALSNKINENVDVTAKEVKRILKALRERGVENATFDYIFSSDCPENWTKKKVI
jgi:ABC-type Zn uptake system ZnuABC Zn-binding protein ZnuA